MSTPFIHPIEVKPTDIDSLKHVNNEVYLRWLIEAAVAHSANLGYTMKSWLDRGHAFVVKRHELDYRMPAYLGDVLHVRTWTESFEFSRGIRHYELIREKDSRVILSGLTVWVYIDLKTGRPSTIPDDVLAKYMA